MRLRALGGEDADLLAGRKARFLRRLRRREHAFGNTSTQLQSAWRIRQRETTSMMTARILDEGHKVVSRRSAPAMLHGVPNNAAVVRCVASTYAAPQLTGASALRPVSATAATKKVSLEVLVD